MEVDSIAADSSSANPTSTQTDGSKKVKKKKARVSANAAPAPSVPPPELQPRVRRPAYLFTSLIPTGPQHTHLTRSAQEGFSSSRFRRNY